MLLAIDVGNTNSVFAVMERDGTIRSQWRLATDVARTADAYAFSTAWFLGQKHLDLSAIDAACIACVAPAALRPLRFFIEKYLPNVSAPLVVGADLMPSGPIAVDYPEEVGADRLANAEAATRLYPNRACVVIDFGTATTFDVIDGKGVYQGGVIVPGVETAMHSLRGAAAKLPDAGFARPSRVVGKNTLGALTSGMFYGYLSMAEGLVARIRDEMREDFLVVATGGLAEIYADCGTLIDECDADLTVKGMYYMYARHVSST
ncbi:MAG: type III pantothenate kinase [Rickettsiales bacterium]